MSYTPAQLAAALLDFAAANPEAADQPVGFSPFADQSSVYHVGTLALDDDCGAVCLMRHGHAGALAPATRPPVEQPHPLARHIAAGRARGGPDAQPTEKEASAPAGIDS